MEQRRLWQAVLRQAHRDAMGRRSPGDTRHHASRLRAQVGSWLFSDDFKSVCVLAGITCEPAKRVILKALRRGGMIRETNRYDGLDPMVADAVSGTEVDRVSYIDYVKSMDPAEALNKIERDLDKIHRLAPSSGGRVAKVQDQ